MAVRIRIVLFFLLLPFFAFAAEQSDPQLVKVNNCNKLKNPQRTGWHPNYNTCIDILMEEEGYRNWALTPEQARSMGCEGYPNLTTEEKSQAVKAVMKAWSRTETEHNPKYLYKPGQGPIYNSVTLGEKNVASGDNFGLMGIKKHDIASDCNTKTNDPYRSIACAMKLMDQDIHQRKSTIWASANFMKYEKGPAVFKKNLSYEIMPDKCTSVSSGSNSSGSDIGGQ